MPPPSLRLYQQLLSAWIGVSPEEGEETARPALERAMRAVLGQPSELLPLVAHMMGFVDVQDVSGVGPHEPRSAAAGNFWRSTRSHLPTGGLGPTVLVLEDLHWADPTSLRLTEELAPLARDGPLLVLSPVAPSPTRESRPWRPRFVLTPGSGPGKWKLSPSPTAPRWPWPARCWARQPRRPSSRRCGRAPRGTRCSWKSASARCWRAGLLVRDQDGWHAGPGRGRQHAGGPERLVRSRVDRLGPTRP